MTVRVIDRLSEVAAGADALLLDMWGVLHDGFEAYPGVVAALADIRRAGKRTLLLSNAPRPVDLLAAQIARLGIGPDLYDMILSSGQAVRDELAARNDPFFAALGRRFLHMGPQRDRPLFAGLDYEEAQLEEAEFVLNTGPWDPDETLEDYLPALQAARARDLPMVCANPDLVVMQQGRPLICAGALAERYAEMGGRVAQRGKPLPEIYDRALAMLDLPADRVMAVGDALHTDIAGAHRAGIRAVFVTRGIHAAELGIAPGDTPTPSALADLYSRHGETPLAALPTLRW